MPLTPQDFVSKWKGSSGVDLSGVLLGTVGGPI
jgi:hypothetical protein